MHSLPFEHLGKRSTPLAPDLVAVHAAFASPDEVVIERRSLYRLAARLVGVPGAVADDVLDSPLVRYRLGGALAGKIDLTGRDLTFDLDSIGRLAHAGLSVVADPTAQGTLADFLRIIGPVEDLRLLTSDDPVFDRVLDVISAGVRLVGEVGGMLAADLLAHVDLIAVVDPATSGGLVSASSRYFPGLVLIEQPSTAMDVAEALIHEGAHAKFFDLAITRSFFDVNSDRVEKFTPSWSDVRWPFEQVYAGWHAYVCLAQFARGLNGAVVGPNSLLHHAAGRAREIERWLICHENGLLVDARRMLSCFVEIPVSENAEPPRTRGDLEKRKFVANPLVLLESPLSTGRLVIGLPGPVPELFWLEKNAFEVLKLFLECAHDQSLEDVFGLIMVQLGGDSSQVRVEFHTVVESLLERRLITPLDLR